MYGSVQQGPGYRPRDPVLRRCSSCTSLVHPTAEACPGCGKTDPYSSAQEIPSVQGAALVALVAALLCLAGALAAYLLSSYPA